MALLVQLRLLRPFLVLAISTFFLLLTAFELLTTLQLGKFTSWSAFQHAWFGRFWSYFGPMSKEVASPCVKPLLGEARGVVLDIGPGSGLWLDLFSATNNDKITKIYGVEPNPEHHPALRAAVRGAGLDAVYEILPVGVEDLENAGIPKGSVDTIATIQVLCSVPGPQQILKQLYPYLKPGGQWLVYEHVRTNQDHKLMSLWQGESSVRRVQAMLMFVQLLWIDSGQVSWTAAL